MTGIWRYPVKSMLGESLSECEVGPKGFVGDRAFALVDAEDGSVASAKNPRKWAALLGCQARFVEEPAGVVEITLVDGTTVRTDDPDVDERLSAMVGRPVRLSSTSPANPTFEEVWPKGIEGLAPEPLIAGTTVATDEDGQRVSRLPLASAAPEGTFFDLAAVHVLTTTTLNHLQSLAPAATFDVRRYRPNVLVDTAAATDGFPENDWQGRKLQLGDDVSVAVTIPTMRCVMTTLAQGDLPQDRDTLRAIAANNRVDIPGWGTWACAGAYADVSTGGTVRVGDRISLH